TGPTGTRAGKTADQQAKVTTTLFDLELKSVPFLDPAPPLLPERLVQVIEAAGVVARCQVRSFDHYLVQEAARRNPILATAVLIAGTAPLFPEDLLKPLGARLYCPDYEFLREVDVSRLHEQGIAVVPWTVNDPPDWERLLSWGVDGITTDF